MGPVNSDDGFEYGLQNYLSFLVIPL